MTDTHAAPLRLRLHNELTIVVPATLSAITTYVLLEQEEWFEKEINFLHCFLKSGMTAIDIGANVGVYSLPLARLVGPTGRVFSYEPGSDARALLECSRGINNLGNLDIIAAALSDSDREGHLAAASSSEMRALGPGDNGDPVRVTSLDLECRLRAWPSVDFIKIDAEGEEERIIAGGRAFFANHSPLVMFEVMSGGGHNERLRALFPSIGYRVFRQLPGAPILIAHDSSLPLDPYELNLFAAKSDRVGALSRQGLLADTLPAWAPGDNDRRHAASLWRQQKFAVSAAMSAVDGEAGNSEYQNSLAAYATWRNCDQPPTIRCSALVVALRSLRALCAHAYTAERASTLARVAWEWGARAESVAVLRQLLQFLQSNPVQLKEPFWPASPRFDNVAPGDQPAEWFAAAAAEQIERTFHFSTRYSGGSEFLDWLCNQRFASAEMERRRTLIAARAGLRPGVPERLCSAAPDHLNADIWRAGLVPQTVVDNIDARVVQRT
jgi:FkbM family methyltransferase